MTSPSLSPLALALCVGSVLLTAASALAQTPPAPARPSAPKAARAPAARALAAQEVQKPSAAGRDDVVARVGSTNVRIEDVRAFVATLDPREQEAIMRDPALLSQAVRAMLANQLVLTEATEKKWDLQPDIAAQLRRLRNNAVIDAYLRSVSIPGQEFPSEAEVASAYDANKPAFLAPRQFQIAQIFVALAKDADKVADDAARKKLADVQARLRQPGADFGAVAKTFSDDRETSTRGGEIGWVPEPQIKPEIKTQVMSLAKGAMSEPIKLDDGWHIVKLIDTKPAYTRPLTEVRDFLVQRLRAQRADVNRRAYVAKLLERSPPAINEIALSKVFGTSAQAAGQ